MTDRAAHPTFDEVFLRVRAAGRAGVISSRGTHYTVTAETAGGRRVLVARPRSGQVRIHEDCWDQDLTCQGTRAGGVFKGSPSIYDWHEARR